MVAVAAIVFVLVWVLFAASPCGANCTGAETTFGSAVNDPHDFLITVLDSVTVAGLYFVVASGFTLIFGLMRVVNMAHGAFFLFGGYIALKLQRDFVGGNSAFGLLSSQVHFWEWLVPALIAALCIGLVGLGTQQAFLRWNQGQELRQALITIAIAVILADQMIDHFGAFTEDISWPGVLDKRIRVHLAGVEYSLTRLVILAIALAVGAALWLWLKKTRTGMVIRAGVDDRQMVSALGVNIQLTFAIAFFVGSALAGFGGAIGGSFASLGPGVDGNWLLYSLVVVIIGGMGSLVGAAVGSLLLGLVSTFSAVYLPTNSSYYSIIFTFGLLALVLAFRPQGLFGRPA
ncbi:MAG: ABC transporter ATP-binding protein [Candidatus Rokuibacteriota bacterium]|nr:MAG: ABC transporter ATP-binding protein [Candidatus Rokubacteria bacterium]